MTGAVAAAPSVGEPAHHSLDRMGFYSFGQHLKPAVCEKYHNPKNSRNACTGTTPANDCGVMSLGHSPATSTTGWGRPCQNLTSRNTSTEKHRQAPAGAQGIVRTQVRQQRVCAFQPPRIAMNPYFMTRIISRLGRIRQYDFQTRVKSGGCSRNYVRWYTQIHPQRPEASGTAAPIHKACSALHIL